MVEIVCAPDVEATPEQVQDSNVFQQWISRDYGEGIIVSRVYVTGAYGWGEPYELRMLHAYVTAHDADGRKLDGVSMIRGATVDVLAIIKAQETGDQHVVFVQQPRVPAMQLCVTSNPAGMVDTGETVVLAALRELGEEMDEPNLVWEDVTDIGAFVTGCELPIVVTPGGSDETVGFLTANITLPQAAINRLNGKFGGAAHENERVKVLIKPFAEAIPSLRVGGAIDLKALTSLLLYKEYLAAKASQA